MGRVKKIESELKEAVERKAPKRRRKAKAGAEAPEAEAQTSGPTVTTGEVVTIEDLSFTPPIRAHGATEAQAQAAYEHQVELRGRHDAQAETPSPGVQTSDLTPGRVEN